MNLNAAVIALSVTALAAAAAAQTQEAQVVPNTSRKQSGTVGPPLDAASRAAPGETVTRPPAASTPAPVVTPEVQTPAEETSPPPQARTGPPSRKASGRVTEAGAPNALPTRADRN